MKMFRNHVVKKLSAYCNGQLASDEAGAVADHLLTCRRCRREYDEIKLGVNLAESLPLVEAPAGLWDEIEAALDRTPASTAPRRWQLPFLSIPGVGYALAAAALVAIIAGSVWYLTRTRTGPEPQIAEHTTHQAPTTRDVVLEEGQSLETDDTWRARFKVGTIGNVEIEPNTRVQMVTSKPNEYRLALDRGTLSAKVLAPPRLFFVNTPSAEAVDLGCAYTLTVDREGRGFLHVTSGWVALAREGREVYVPIGAMCEIRPDVGPGTPYFDDASDDFLAALRSFDFEGGETAALDVVLAQSRDKDSFTLWHLLSRVDEIERNRVLDRMIKLVGLPKQVTREGIMKLNQKMLDQWKDDLDVVWFQ